MDPIWAQFSADFQGAGMTESEVARLSLEEKRSVLAAIYESGRRPLPPLIPDNITEPPLRVMDVPTPGLRIDHFLRLPASDESRRAEGVADYADLRVYWRTMVADLAIYPAIERTRYSQQIQAAVKKLGPEATTGVVIGLILPTGMRIMRTFAWNAPGSVVYIWAAGDEKMIRDMTKPGTFVILRRDGAALRPNDQLSYQIEEPRVLMNVQIIR
jgi:hypothetical protein